MKATFATGPNAQRTILTPVYMHIYMWYIYIWMCVCVNPRVILVNGRQTSSIAILRKHRPIRMDVMSTRRLAGASEVLPWVHLNVRRKCSVSLRQQVGNKGTVINKPCVEKGSVDTSTSQVYPAIAVRSTGHRPYGCFPGAGSCLQ